jgi:hypothetical protein
MPHRVVFWGKTERLRLEHIPALKVTRLVERGTERLLAEVEGHPTDRETHERLASALQGAQAAFQRDLRVFRPLAPQSWRGKPAA